MIKPISPEEIETNATKPDEVIQVFNELIKKYWDGTQAKIKQDEIIELIADRMSIKVNAVFENKYLDVEYLYRIEGWMVEYDKPGYNENPYLPMFIFSKPSK